MKKKIILLISFILILFAITRVFTLARYASNSIWNYYLNSKGFYFESNYLGETEKINTHNTWSGTSVNFNLKNYQNDNMITDDDISYEVECELSRVDAECHLNGTNSNKINATLIGGVISTSPLYFDIVSNTDISDIEVRITAKSTAPYRKTLRGRFILHKVENISGNIEYEVENNDIYSKLFISNYYNENKCLTVSWNNSDIRVVREDNMSNIATNLEGVINQFDINIASNNTLYIRYYNIGDGILNKNTFSILECQ